MKKMLTRVLALALVLMAVFGLYSSAFAAKVTSISQTSDADGDCKLTFYVKTNGNIFSKKLTMSMTKGTLAVEAHSAGKTVNVNHYDAVFVGKVPDSYEITIWYWNAKTGKWVQEQNYDIWCKTSATIKLKKADTYYKIKVDSYGAKTTVKSYVNNGKLGWSDFTLGDFDTMFNAHLYFWKNAPAWTIKNGQNCTIYNSNPVN